MAVTTAGPTVATDAAGSEPRPRSSSWVVQVTALSLILGSFLGLALQAQRSIREARLPANRFDQLVPHYEALKEANQNLQQEVKVLRQKTVNYETQMARGGDMAQTLKKELERLQVLAGLTAMEGPGLVITLRDAPPHVRAKAQESAGQGMDVRNQVVIHDQDLAIILNELRAAGVEAIAISGADRSRPQRVIGNSAPRCSGPAIKVNDALITGPFTIWAIGNPTEVESALRMPGGLIEHLGLEPLEMMEIEKRDRIRVPAYSSSTQHTYARPVKADTPSDAP